MSQQIIGIGTAPNDGTGATLRAAGSIINANFTEVYSGLTTAQTGITVATLPAAAAALQGQKSFVTDATQTMTAGIGAIVAGGGSNKVPVYCDGTNWRIG